MRARRSRQPTTATNAEHCVSTRENRAAVHCGRCSAGENGEIPNSKFEIRNVKHLKFASSDDRASLDTIGILRGKLQADWR